MQPASPSDWLLLPALLEWLEFLTLALLGFLLVQLIHWETAFRDNQAGLLAGMRQRAGQLRTVRRQLDSTGGEWPALPMSASLRKKWNVVRWAGKAFSMAKRSCS